MLNGFDRNAAFKVKMFSVQSFNTEKTFCSHNILEPLEENN